MGSHREIQWSNTEVPDTVEKTIKIGTDHKETER